MSEQTTKGVHDAVVELHASDWLVYIATTGAVGDLVRELWKVPGSSNTIIGAELLYHRSQVERFLGFIPEHFVSKDTAMRLAAEAHAKCRREAERMTGPLRPALGLGMTATVATDREKKGRHRMHVAVRTDEIFHHLEVEFQKGYRSRDREGMMCDTLSLGVLLKAAGIRVRDPYMFGLSIVEEGTFCPGSPRGSRAGWYPWRNELIWPDGNRDFFDDCAEHRTRLRRDYHLIYPGSFNPLHSGHEAVADLAERMTSLEVVYQLNDGHPVKGQIPDEELFRRAGQFSHRKPVLISRGTGLYIDKAARFPGFAFLLGADATLGLLDPAYYGGTDGLLNVLERFKTFGTRFYVVGRKVNGRFMTLEDVPIPPRYAHLFRAVSGRWDISSSELRAKG